MKFEMSFRAAGRGYVRVFDPETNQSSIEVLPAQFESYIEDPTGDFKGFYNPKIKYRKVLGDYKSSRNNIGMTSPQDIVIRDRFGERGSYNQNPRVFYLDIETRSGTVSQGFPAPEKALEPVCLVQIKDSLSKKIYIIGVKEFFFSKWYLNRPEIKDEEVIYIQCKTEEGIFENLFNLIQTLKPVIVYAWNGDGFDNPYLYNRSQKLGLDANNFSPFKSHFGGHVTKLKEKELHGRYYASLESAGIFYMDKIDLYKKFILAPRESYALNAIAELELKAKKISHDEFRTFDDFFLGNWIRPKNPTEDEKNTLCYRLNERGEDQEIIRKAGYGQFVFYGIIDVVILYNLDHKLGLTKLMVSVAENQSSQLIDVLGTTRPWGNATLSLLHKNKQVVDSNEIDVDLEKNISGGFVRQPEKGKQTWVVSEDVNSMYPILAIAGGNMSPENFIFARDTPADLKNFAYTHLKIGTPEEQNEENLLLILKDPKLKQELIYLLKKYNLSMAPNGTFYDLSIQGVIPEMVKDIYKNRKIEKKGSFRAMKIATRLKEELESRDLKPH